METSTFCTKIERQIIDQGRLSSAHTVTHEWPHRDYDPSAFCSLAASRSTPSLAALCVCASSLSEKKYFLLISGHSLIIFAQPVWHNGRA